MKDSVVVAVLVLIVKLPLLLLRFVLRNKILLIGAIVVVGVVIVSRQYSQSVSVQEIPQHQVIAPSAEKAPYAVATTSRSYYVVSYSDNGEVISLEEYYYYDSGKWVRQTKLLDLDRSIYGEIRIYER